MRLKPTQTVITIILVISQLFVLFPFNAFAQEVPADGSTSITETAPTVETASATSEASISPEITADISSTDSTAQLSETSTDSSTSTSGEKSITATEPEAQTTTENQAQLESTTTSTTPPPATMSSVLENNRDHIGNQQKDRYKFSANEFNGSFGYSYPLDLPAGRDGLTPLVSFDYNNLSGNDSSELSRGWNLGGLSFISRESETGLQNLYTSNQFSIVSPYVSGELKGVTINAYGVGKYQLKVYQEENSFQFNGSKWEVFLVGGTKLVFGDRNESQLGDGNLMFRWYLDKIVDSNGNAINYHYFKDGNNVYLDSITYGGNEMTGLPDFITVDFVYQSRDDKQESYRTYFKIEYNQLLAEVRISLDGNSPQRIYSLAYKKGDNSIRNLLEKIILKSQGTDGVWIERTESEFGYYPFTEESETCTVPTDFIFGSKNYGGYGVKWTDINGDGLVDFVYSYDQKDVIYNNYTYVRTDYIYDRATYLRKKDGTFVKSTEYEIPMPLAKVETDNYGGQTRRVIYRDMGVMFIDMNNDGLNDISPNYLNTGSGFTTSDKWSISSGVALKEVRPDNYTREYYADDAGIQFVDYNLDGLVDVVSGTMLRSSSGEIHSGEVNVNLNKGGNGWETRRKLIDAQGFVVNMPNSNIDTGRRLLDVNNDGLLDLVFGEEAIINLQAWPDPSSKAYTKRVFINKWLNFEEVSDPQEAARYLPEVTMLKSLYGDRGAGTKFLDVNLDGIVDLGRYGGGWCWDRVSKLYFGTGNGFIEANRVIGGYQGTTLPGTNCSYGSGTVIPEEGRTARINGIKDSRSSDSYLEKLGIEYIGMSAADKPYEFSGCAINKSSRTTDYLKTVRTVEGKEITVSYKKSSEDYTDELGETRLPAIAYVVDKVAVKEILNETREYQYNYYDGFYYKDIQDVYENQNAGFRRVKTTQPDGTYSVKYFHQGEGARQYPEIGEVAEHISKKGNLWRVEKYDSANRLLAVQGIAWENTDKGNDISQVIKRNEFSSVYNSDGTFYSTGNGYEYSEAGLLSAEIQYGLVEVQGETFDDVGDDSKKVEYEYALTASGVKTNFVVGKVMKDNALVKVAEEKYYYDDLPFGQASKGNATKIEQWLDTENRYIAVERIINNQYGQPTEIFDAINNRTQLVYDDKSLYAREITNAKGFKQTTENNLLLGKPIRQKFYNNEEIVFVYDGLGRVTKTFITNKTGSGLFQLFEVVYSDLATPRSIEIKEYSSEAKHKESVIYLDGFSQNLMSKEKKAENEYITIANKFNKLGLLVEKSYPYIEGSKNYTATPAKSNGVEKYEYDGLRRLTKTIKPTGESRVEYFNLTQKSIDENQKQKEATSDVFVNLIQIKEYNGGAIYTTAYGYNALNQLTKIQDNQNNTREFTFDSLGRLDLSPNRKRGIIKEEI